MAINFPGSPVLDQEHTDGNGVVWKYNGEMWIRQPGGATTFTGLSDTPADYVGAAGQVATVNGTEDGLIFQAGSGGVAWGAITGTLSDQIDLQAALDGKAASGHNHDGTYAPLAHTHDWADITTGTQPAPVAHAASHQNGGADEISVAGLSGLLADPQTPATHTHNVSADADNVLVNGTDTAAYWDGDYNDLINAPVIPPAGVPEAPNDGVSYARKSEAWAQIDYDDLANQPTIPPDPTGTYLPLTAGAGEPLTGALHVEAAQSDVVINSPASSSRLQFMVGGTEHVRFSENSGGTTFDIYGYSAPAVVGAGIRLSHSINTVAFLTNAGAVRWTIDANGHLIPTGNKALDIGTGVQKVREGNFEKVDTDLMESRDNTHISPSSDNSHDWGSVGARWKQGFFAGTVEGADPTADAHFVTRGYAAANYDPAGTYLPLTAGSGEKITGELFINMATPRFWQQIAGVNSAQLSSAANQLTLTNYDAAGAQTDYIQLNSGNMRFFFAAGEALQMTESEYQFKIAGTEYYRMRTEAFRPGSDNASDIGTSGLRFKDSYFSGTVQATSIQMPSAGTLWVGNAASNNGFLFSDGINTDLDFHCNGTNPGYLDEWRIGVRANDGWTLGAGSFRFAVCYASDHNTGSDPSLKKNIEPMFSGVLEKMKRVSPIQFNWKTNGKRTMGLNGVELREQFPLASPGPANEPASMSLAPTVAVLWAAVQELTAKLEALEA